MTIYEIKERTKETAPYFFSRSTLRFFGQTMKSFKVYKNGDGWLIQADMFAGRHGRYVGQTCRLFNPKINELERI